ncbi:MAG TPA: nucleoside-diphosphate sugar epimerase/dehydratase [Spirochaetota bacterium]|nr:polysaccharide biosynthesis protein [Spirochaetota bacterium]HOD14869.1 nucleoside-diphosphate sugar epimerase/dehydratase [Spirochaetota bacterium]HPG49293.1 nucleoside-diphosphate sugar epimerase/dehydratase [Spirochaetota bacterium]HPN10731.1 nucleoside-diphosphate sugar epimerase/dehydratase [Spirochaetota bacterium]HQL81185.1 nucleoside-diphosphate sugar epimerase/dehydratase [Spirochaetota bacterium]
MGLFYTIRGKKIIFPVLDAVIAAGSYAAACLIRFYPDTDYYREYIGPEYIVLLALLYVLSSYLFQIYRMMWAYSNISDMYRLLMASASGFIVYFACLHAADMPYSMAVLVMTFLITTLLCSFYRIVIRDLYSRRAAAGEAPVRSRRGKKVLVVGAGEAGRVILSEYIKRGLGRMIAGFVDDDPEKVGTILNGKMVFCDTGGASRLVRDRAVSEVIIAMPSVGSEKINRIASLIRRDHRSIPIKVLPHAFELDERKPLSISLRDIGISDLIGREEVRVDAGAVEKKFAGKTVLITGAGGSIGCELCRQLLKYGIRKLVAVGRGEFSMYNLIRVLNEDAAFLSGGTGIEYRIADIKDRRLLGAIFDRHRPDIVFHAAAHKHVPLMEFNEAEAVQNNVGGTMNVLDLALEYGAAEFVFISTDKAVNPTSIMGATKRIAEIITGHYYRERGLKTSIVRFGNVIGSRGSVIPLFMEQIERGGPVTVTHPDVTRYFMSIPEASLLVINAAAYSSGGELFVLDMGRQYRVAEIAKRLIEFYGYRSDDQIRIEYTGLRPGEKMHEDLFYEDSTLVRTQNEKVFILSESGGTDTARIERFMKKDLPRVAGMSPAEIRALIKKIVPGFESDPESAGAAQNKKLIS